MSDTAVKKGHEFLEHYGTKGMKWGKSGGGGTASIKGPSTAKIKDGGGGTIKLKTKEPSKISFKKKDQSPTETSAQSTLTRKGKAQVKTKGGERQAAAGDAIKTATLKQKLKKSGTDSMSNQELQELSTRMNLETQVDRLSKQQTSDGKKFVRNLVKNTGEQQTQRLVNTRATQFVDNQMNKAGGVKRRLV